MKTIYKYPLEITDEQNIEMPLYAKPLCVQMQDDRPCLWAEVDSEFPGGIKTVYTFGTGHPIEQTSIKYLRTYQTKNNLVFHVYV